MFIFNNRDRNSIINNFRRNEYDKKIKLLTLEFVSLLLNVNISFQTFSYIK